MRTGQPVGVNGEVRHSRAEAEFRRNVACAARSSFLGVCTLVSQTGRDEHKVDVPVSWLPSEQRALIALHCPSSVGIRPVEFLIERFSADGLLVYQLGTLSTKMRTGQFVALEIEVVHSAAAPQLGWNSTCKIFG